MYFIKCGEVRVVRKMLTTSKLVQTLKNDPILSSRFSPNEMFSSKFKSLPSSPVVSPRGFAINSFATFAKSTPQELPQQQEVWVEVNVLGPHDTFGENALAKECKRNACIIANTYTELLVLSRHDAISHITGSAKKQLDEYVQKRMSTDDKSLFNLQKTIQWEKYKYQLVTQIMLARNKQKNLVDFTRYFSIGCLWKP
eukprot:TRINITY_DN4246_c1_g1_i1.p1 TRINITY_DN4246_c1_g1~~TRINITY_DN4246_c1_g1_i1.p1  ORF type:complete len:198 (-),score=10.47 TRINITY_DN4246_c1_g1_i1:49-642(-)